MKLAKHSLFKVLIISSLVIALTGCDAILGKLLPQAELDGPDYPSVEIADYGDGSATLHYGDEKTLTVTASVDDGGSLSYQWYKGTTNNTDKASAISGETSASYKITAPSEEVEKTYYWCKVTNKKNGKTADKWSYAYAITVSNIIKVTNIVEPTTWKFPYTYYVEDGNYWVSKALTIEPGVVVKFGKEGRLTADETGYILAEGTSEKPIYFTSYRDNTKGITIPDEAGSTVQKGDWKGVLIMGATGSKFDHCVFSYADQSALGIYKKSTVTNCTFTNNKSSIEYSGALTIVYIDDVTNGGQKSEVKNNCFYNNDWPLDVPTFYTVDTSNIFHNPNNAEEKNANQAIVLRSVTIPSSNVANWEVEEVPYFFASDFMWLNGTLNIGMTNANVVVKFWQNGKIDDENGVGTFKLGPNVILTSYRDKDVRGDIFNGDEPADAAVGDWRGIKLGNQWAFKNDARVKYAKFDD